MLQAHDELPRRGPRFDTLAVRGSYTHAAAAANGGSICEPAYTSPAQHFPTAAAMRDTLLGREDGWVYSRLGNPTIGHLEDVLALLEGYGTGQRVSTCVAPSGMAAIYMAAAALVAARVGHAEPGNIVIPASCYGGSYMLFTEQFGRDRGLEVRMVFDTLDLTEWESLIDDDTRFVFCETPSNPLLMMTDVPALSRITQAAGTPLMVDATIPGPALMRPLGMGADIVVHSASKTMSASGLGLAGAISARHGIPVKVDQEDAGTDFARHVRKGLQRSSGIVLSASNALQTIADLRSLRSRMIQMSASALEIARRLEGMHGVRAVHYPGLSGNPGHEIARRDMRIVDSELDPGGPASAYGYLLSLEFTGGQEAAIAFFDALSMIWRANDLGRIKSCATMPAISTHSQLSEEEKAKGGVPADLVRLSVGCEHLEDIFADLEQAMAKVATFA